MIINTELEYKGDLYPSKITAFRKEVDSVFFHTDNSVILKVTVLRDSMIRFRYTTKGYFSNDFSYAIDKGQSHGYNFLEVKEEDRALHDHDQQGHLPDQEGRHACCDLRS
jgi:alpha-glucosidase